MYYYQHHIGDYRRDTQHLTLLEHGIYRQLLDLYYITESPIADATVMRLICARTTEEMQATVQILAEFFDLRDGLYHHKRCDEEIERYQDKSRKASDSAKARWDKAADADVMRSHSDRSPDGMLTINHKPLTINQEPITALGAKRATQLPADFKANDTHIKLANELGIILESEFVKFSDYCVANGKTYKDWNAALRNWLRNARSYSRSTPAKPAARHSFKDVDYGESGNI